MSDAKPAVRVRSRTPATAAPVVAPAAPSAPAPRARRTVTPAAASASVPAVSDAGRPRIRSRIGAAPAPASRVAGQTVGGDGSTDWMKSGAAAQAEAEKEKRRLAERQAAGARGELYAPRRFEVEQGHTKEIIVLDAELACFIYEHKQYDATKPVGRRDVFEPCPREHQICPLCEGMANGKESYYVLFLTVIDLNPGYTDRATQQWVPLTKEVDGVRVPRDYARYLMAVKVQQQDAYFSIANELGTLRGLQLVVTRGTDRYSPQSGVVDMAQSKDESGNWIVHSEQDLIDSFGGPATYSEVAEGQEPVLIRVENADTFPYDYGHIFKRPDAADLRTRYGGANAAASAPAGSRQANTTAAGEAGAPW